MEKVLRGDRGQILKSTIAIRLFMLIVAILLSLKYIFVDFGIDAEFQIAMSYRLTVGDVMFKEMWEPYQMSSFLCAFFIKIYLNIFHTTTGIVLYLQVLGVLIDGLIAYILYRVVNKYLHCSNVAFVMAWVFFLISPKDVPLAEYANMQIWFSLLLCVTMFLYYKTNKKRMVILSAICLCGAILSYPSCLLLFMGAVFFIYRVKKKDVFIFSFTCVLMGILYLCLIFKYISISDFYVTIENILSIETSHSGWSGKGIAYLKDLFSITMFFCITYGVSCVISKIICNKIKRAQNKESCKILTDVLFYGFTLVVSIYTILFWENYIRYAYSLLFLGIILIGMRYAGRLSSDMRYFYLCGTVVSFLDFASTLLLTNLELLASVPYLLIALIASFLPISEVLKTMDVKGAGRSLIKASLFCGGAFLIFRNIYIIRPMNGDVSTILKIHGIVKEGPAAGIITEYMGAYMQNESIKEWEQYIEDGSSIYLIGGSLDTLGYLYSNTTIAAPSVVPTPGYNESVLKYWEINPDKYPDVIIASCWYGTMNPELGEDSWIMRWIEEEYKPQYYVDGKYWRYYFR